MFLFSRLKTLFNRSALSEEIEDGLNCHIEMRIADSVAAGVNPDVARRDLGGNRLGRNRGCV
jgi:hypothetical protein